jgi:hypothetical protein
MVQELHGFRLGLAIVVLVGVPALSGCTSAPPEVEAARQWAWEDHPYQLRPGDWTPDVRGDCKNKALAIAAQLRAQGYTVTDLVGCRADQPGCRVHMVPVASRRDGWYVIDEDGVFARADYPWRNIKFDVEAKIAASPAKPKATDDE